MILGSGIVSGSIVAIVLNLLFNGLKVQEKKESKQEEAQLAS